METKLLLVVLTDEQSVAHSDELIAKVAYALRMTRASYPEASLEALSQILFMVNGPEWMSHSEMARARIAAKQSS